MNAKKYLIVCLVGCVFFPFNLWGDGDVYCGGDNPSEPNIYNLSAEDKSIGCVCRSGDTFILTLRNPQNLYWKIVSDKEDDACVLEKDEDRLSMSTGAERTKYTCTCPDDDEPLTITARPVYKGSSLPKTNSKSLSLSTEVSKE